ncbi:MAG: CHAD domain-containing protein [Betaproteobacteria bacterium]|nr:CHAD domain-containing protein [Betaproteobacteria bacterium]
MNTEIELKLAIDPADAVKLRRQGWLRARAGKPVRRKVTTIYLDTPDNALKDRGIALRVRRTSRGWVQTLKDAGEALAGLHERAEWEVPIPKGEPDFGSIAESPWASVFTRDLQDRLQKVFSTDFWRTTWLIEDGDSLIELALDLGQIVGPQGQADIAEIELELKRGEVRALFDVALRLASDIPLRLESRSKAARGYALGHSEAPQAVKAVSPTLRPEMDANAAFRPMLEQCLSHLQDNVQVFLSIGDGESLHQARVAVRRLRAALSILSAVVPAGCVSGFVDELRWLMSHLGPARDWDILRTRFMGPLEAQVPENGALDGLKVISRRAQAESWEAARTALASPRFTKLALSLGGWLAAQQWCEELTPTVSESLAQPIILVARRILRKRHKRLLAQGGQGERLTPEQTHRLRIAGKKTRYTAEFFSSLFDPTAVRRYVKALTALQDNLGRQHDAVVAIERLNGLTARQKDPQLAWAMGAVAGWSLSDAAWQADELPGLWARFRSRRPFWNGP